MQAGDLLGSWEHVILLALVQLNGTAHGMAIRREIEARTGRDVSIGAVYSTLLRLETKGFIGSRLGAPTSERGGRAKRLFHLKPRGEQALRVSAETLRNMTNGLNTRLGTT